MTEGFRVVVQSTFVPERSDPENHAWFYAYRVQITNEGERTAQLVSRHWVITDDLGHMQEVRGAGVVGEQPVLRPGQSFEYTSGCPLTTEQGTMHGSYRMVGEDGSRFEVEIAPFALGEPTQIH